MIYYSSTPLKSWQPNLIMLDLEDDLGHIYVTRNTYDQAILLSDRFNHDSDLVMQKLGCPANQEDVASYMIAILPAPINILTPFYHLIDTGVELNLDNIKQVIGVLSYMSMNLDFNMMLKVPFEVRANLVFTKSILLDYQGHFEDFNFKIYSEERHIISEGLEGDSKLNRKEKQDFELVENEQKEEGIDLDDFFSSIGWDDIKVPSLSEVVATLDETAASSESPKEVNSDFSKQVNEADVYESIANKFV